MTDDLETTAAPTATTGSATTFNAVMDWPFNQLRGSLFARSLRCKLNRLENRRLSDDVAAATAVSDSGCLCGACGCATALSSSLTERPPGKEDISFLLGRFLSGSDPALARGSFEVDDDQRSNDDFVDDLASPPTPDNGIHGVLVNNFVMDDLDNVGEEEDEDEDERDEEDQQDKRSSAAPTRMDGSVSSGYGSEVDVQHGRDHEEKPMQETPHFSLQSSMIDADFLLGGRALGSACSLTTDDGSGDSSGLSTPLPSLMMGGSQENLPAEMVEESERSVGLVGVPDSAIPKTNFLTFKTGEETHKVATSKLNNLLNLLEKSSKVDSAKSPGPQRCDSAPSLVVDDVSRPLKGSGGSFNSMVEIKVTPPTNTAVASSPGCKSETEAATTARLQRELKETLSEPEKPRKLRKASSLKTGKTPPNTPGKSKIVRLVSQIYADLSMVASVASA
jgi:hypothetical protein